MRTFQTLEEAISEIQRDLSKGPSSVSTRVQQKVGLNLKTRERVCYQYLIEGGWPEDAEGLVDLGIKYFDVFRQYPEQIRMWLVYEEQLRTNAASWNLDSGCDLEANEVRHPLLQSAKEGNYYSYTYHHRLSGTMDRAVRLLMTNRDTRRCYIPIFYPEDFIRANSPTRIPCSLGYDLLVRRVGVEEFLMMVYIMRSCDFDHFWLTDIFLARKFQEYLARQLEIEPGVLIHDVISFHTFPNEEIY